MSAEVVSNMARCSSKTNELRDIDSIGCRERGTSPFKNGHQAPTISSIDKSLSRNRHRVLSLTNRCGIKEEAKLPTVIGLTTKHAVCCNTLML